MKTTIALLAPFLFAIRLACAAETPLPKEMVLIDAMGKLDPSWVVPAGHGGDCRLAVDVGGNPWLGCKNQFLQGPAYAVLYMTEKPFSALNWLDNGALLAVSGDQVGVFKIDEAAKPGRTTARVPFEPMGQFAGKKVELFGGAGNASYVVVNDEKDSKLLLLWPNAKGDWGVRNLYSSASRITAVGGDGVTTFVATGRRAIELRARPDANNHLALDGEVVFDHTKHDVTTLVYTPKLGLFYATENGVGFIGSRFNLEFLKSPNAQIRLAQGALYVLPKSGGVLKLAGIERYNMKNHQLAAQGAPVNLEVHDGTESRRNRVPGEDQSPSHIVPPRDLRSPRRTASSGSRGQNTSPRSSSSIPRRPSRPCARTAASCDGSAMG